MDTERAIPYPAGGEPRAPRPPRRRFPARSPGPLPSRQHHQLLGGGQGGQCGGVHPTHGGSFGTGVVVGDTGLTFNNGTRIGSTAPDPNHPNYARGGQIPILNNSPVIVLKDGEFVLALGTPGGETIGQTQFQVLLNILDFGMGIQEAVAAPRLALFPDPNFYTPGADILIRLEDRMPPGTLEALLDRGHRAEWTGGYALGSNNGILRNLATGTMTAGADPRRAAYAIGY